MVQIKPRSFDLFFNLFFSIQTEITSFFGRNSERKHDGGWDRIKSARSTRRSCSLAGSRKRGRELRPHKVPSKQASKTNQTIQIEARRIRGKRLGAFQNEATKRKGIHRTERPGKKIQEKKQRRAPHGLGESSRVWSGAGLRRREEDFFVGGGREMEEWAVGLGH